MAKARRHIADYVDKMKGMDRRLPPCPENSVDRHRERELVIDAFLKTPYGRLAWLRLLEAGAVHVPLFKTDEEAREKCEKMASEMGSFVTDAGGRFKEAWLRRKYPNIRGQARLQVPPEDIGGEFLSIVREVERTLKYVLQALDKAGYDDIRVEKSTGLLSLKHIERQVGKAKTAVPSYPRRSAPDVACVMVSL